MIALHRIAHPEDLLYLNADVIVSVEARPDTVVALSTGTKVVVAEAPEAVLDAIRSWRASILTAAMRDLPRRSAAMTLVRGGAGEQPGGAG